MMGEANLKKFSLSHKVDFATHMERSEETFIFEVFLISRPRSYELYELNDCRVFKENKFFINSTPLLNP